VTARRASTRLIRALVAVPLVAAVVLGALGARLLLTMQGLLLANAICVVANVAGVFVTRRGQAQRRTAQRDFIAGEVAPEGVVVLRRLLGWSEDEAYVAARMSVLTQPPSTMRTAGRGPALAIADRDLMCLTCLDMELLPPLVQCVAEGRSPAGQWQAWLSDQPVPAAPVEARPDARHGPAQESAASSCDIEPPVKGRTCLEPALHCFVGWSAYLIGVTACVLAEPNASVLGGLNIGLAALNASLGYLNWHLDRVGGGSFWCAPGVARGADRWRGPGSHLTAGAIVGSQPVHISVQGAGQGWDEERFGDDFRRGEIAPERVALVSQLLALPNGQAGSAARMAVMSAPAQLRPWLLGQEVLVAADRDLTCRDFYALDVLPPCVRAIAQASGLTDTGAAS